MPYVTCSCGVRLRYDVLHNGVQEHWGSREINGCEEMQRKREAEPTKQHDIECERASKLMAADADHYR